MECVFEKSENEAQTSISELISTLSSSFTCFSQNQLNCKRVKGGYTAAHRFPELASIHTDNFCFYFYSLTFNKDQ